MLARMGASNQNSLPPIQTKTVIKLHRPQHELNAAQKMHCSNSYHAAVLPCLSQCNFYSVPGLNFGTYLLGL